MKRHAKGATSDPMEAMKFQDGLMMAMLAAKALRRGNFVAMILGRNLKLTPDYPVISALILTSAIERRG